MRKQVIITILLLIASAFITVFYFKNLNTPGMRRDRIMRLIPDNAALIFEFNNEKGFYDIFENNKLFKAVAGRQKLDELTVLRDKLLLNPLLEKYFTGQNIFISVHPSKTDTVDLLLTMSSANGFEPAVFDQLSKQTGNGLVVTPVTEKGKKGYNIYVNALKKRFYVINREDNILSASFSKDLLDQDGPYKNRKDNPPFVLLSEQQNANSLANLYINYDALSSLFDLFFKNKNTDILKSLRLLPGLATLTLNYRTDALMFNGLTNMRQDKPVSYLNLYTGEGAAVNYLKDIFPSTTAYSVNFAVADPLKFSADLSNWHIRAGLKNEKDLLFNKIRSETGINLKNEFNKLLGNEFAVVTTRYFEKFAIVSVKDGSKLRQLLAGISKTTDEPVQMPAADHKGRSSLGLIQNNKMDFFRENTGQLNYDKLPFFLLGDAFSIFRHPYYMIIDNYLVLANSDNELKSYYDSYINRKFLSKNDQYNQFNNLLAERSNVTFFFHFKNALPILKQDLYPNIYDTFEEKDAGWTDFYAASWQFTAAEKSFYTNICMQLNTGTTIVQNK